MSATPPAGGLSLLQRLKQFRGGIDDTLAQAQEQHAAHLDQLAQAIVRIGELEETVRANAAARAASPVDEPRKKTKRVAAHPPAPSSAAVAAREEDRAQEKQSVLDFFKQRYGEQADSVAVAVQEHRHELPTVVIRNKAAAVERAPEPEAPEEEGEESEDAQDEAVAEEEVDTIDTKHGYDRSMLASSSSEDELDLDGDFEKGDEDSDATTSSSDDSDDEKPAPKKKQSKKRARDSDDDSATSESEESDEGEEDLEELRREAESFTKRYERRTKHERVRDRILRRKAALPTNKKRRAAVIVTTSEDSSGASDNESAESAGTGSESESEGAAESDAKDE